MCAPCLAKAQAEQQEQDREAGVRLLARLNETHEYLHSGAARTALLASGVPPVNIYQIQRELKKKFLSQGNRIVETIISVRHGWILGHLDGEYDAQGECSWHKEHGSQLTALLDHDQVILLPVVRSESGRYEESSSYQSWKFIDGSLEQAAQAVRRLIERHHYSSRRMQIPAGRLGFIRIEEGEEPGRVYEIEGVLSIGQNPEDDIVLRDSHVGWEHATIINQGNGNYALRDEGGMLMTMVNYQGLDRYQLCSLKDGDRIQLGQHVLVFGTK